MRVLVTGGTGFIGRWVVQRLIDSGHRVRVFDAHPNPAVLDELSDQLSPQVEWAQGDMADGSVGEAVTDCDAVIHLAGLMTVDCARDPVRAAHINLMGTLHLMEAIRERGIRRFSYLSTAGVFGPDDAEHPKPMTHYGTQKLAIEGSARSYYLDHGIPSTGFRPYIVYGPGKSSGIAAGPSIALQAAARGDAATIQFSGRAGFVYVEDVAALLVSAVAQPGEEAEVYNLCGETTEMDRFVAQLLKRKPDAQISVKGAPLRITPDLASDPLPARLNHPTHTALEAGIDRTLDFYARRSGDPARDAGRHRSIADKAVQKWEE
ncbi:NAD-dependent epimerase/dehydratase family protein [Sedimenticola sp.]|uniref:NAD-dependent epimerase/dehydratase family protein n=1 Tax=Sedimenticola sp. TaxID=1940285 RepID=UPI003D144AC1